MGVYIYTLRKANPRRTEQGPVYRYKYGWRFCGYEPEYERQMRQEERHADRWGGYVRDGEVSGPILVTVDGVEGGEVYRQHTISPVWSDCDATPGEFVGYLKKEGRKWSIKSVETQLLEDRQFLHAYITEHGLWDAVPSHYSGGIAGQVQMYLKVAYDHLRAPFMKDNVFHVPNQGHPARATQERMSPIFYHVKQGLKKLGQAA